MALALVSCFCSHDLGQTLEHFFYYSGLRVLKIIFLGHDVLRIGDIFCFSPSLARFLSFGIFSCWLRDRGLFLVLSFLLMIRWTGFLLEFIFHRLVLAIILENINISKLIRRNLYKHFTERVKNKKYQFRTTIHK